MEHVQTKKPAVSKRIAQTAGVTAVAAVGLFGALHTVQAAAKPRPASPAQRHACTVAYDEAREQADTGHLLEAKAKLDQCAKLTCDDFVRRVCQGLMAQLDEDVPSIVPVVTDDAGSPHVFVEVRMDGELLTSKLNGLALAVDPGRHELTFSNDSGVFATRRVMVVQGERNRPIAVKMGRSRRRRLPIASEAPIDRAPITKPAVAQGG